MATTETRPGAAAPGEEMDLTEILKRRKAGAERNSHPVNIAHHDEATRGERIADHLASGMGSWRFLMFQTAFMAIWVGLNVFWLLNRGFDPYPFILLNLALSLQATYAGPIVLLAGNRQASKDRLTLEHAAEEAEVGGEAIEKILIEIKRNTELTNQILMELEAANP